MSRDEKMSKPAPLRYDTYYHIYNRGNNRENLFREEQNLPYFLKLYIQYIEPITDTFAYCLLRNHFHFLVRIKDEGEIKEIIKLRNINMAETPSQQFGNMFNAYTKAIKSNRPHI